MVALLAVRRDLLTARELKSNVWVGGRFRPQNRLPRQRPLEIKANYRSFIYSHNSTTLQIGWKICPLDVHYWSDRTAYPVSSSGFVWLTVVSNRHKRYICNNRPPAMFARYKPTICAIIYCHLAKRTLTSHIVNVSAHDTEILRCWIASRKQLKRLSHYARKRTQCQQPLALKRCYKHDSFKQTTTQLSVVSRRPEKSSHSVRHLPVLYFPALYFQHLRYLLADWRSLSGVCCRDW